MFSSSMPAVRASPIGDGALDATIAELRNLCVSLSQQDPRAVADARRLLAAFSAELGAYFDAEERDDTFEALSVDRPSLRSRVVSLEAAHTLLRDRAGGLQRLAHDGSAGARLALRIERVVDEFEAHEQAEDAVVQEFFLRDDGVAGE
jgi:hypothetical protein